MLYYIIFGIIFATILLAFLIELIHSSREKFKKRLKFISAFFLFIFILILMVKFPQLISVLPAIFLILYRWRFLIGFIAQLFLRKKNKSFSSNIDKKEALEILGLDEGATRFSINKRYQELMKINHPDKGGSEWITKQLNKAKETLLG
ncbi:MAG: hypothetical protein ACJ0G4_06710 [Alphaproteobacteria bacterium]|tara:strand:- start:1133 stop:1576 length:444 start_codon:yes stop_codon:yes gene_type:complete